MQSTTGTRSIRIPLLLFGITVLAGASLFFVPAFVIRPFRAQSPASLSLVLLIAQHAPLWTLLALVLALLLVSEVWRHSVRWQKALLVSGIVVIAVSATMARIDYFEWMFHPIRAPGFQPARQTRLGFSEMVMEVQLANDARAYPIRELAYHHVVNDVVSGVPIAVTY